MYVNAALFIVQKTGCSFCPLPSNVSFKLSSDWSLQIYCVSTFSVQIRVKFWPKLCRETNRNSPAKISHHREVILLFSFLSSLIISLAPDFHHLWFLFPVPAGLLPTEVKWVTMLHDRDTNFKNPSVHYWQTPLQAHLLLKALMS